MDILNVAKLAGVRNRHRIDLRTALALLIAVATTFSSAFVFAQAVSPQNSGALSGDTLSLVPGDSATVTPPPDSATVPIPTPVLYTDSSKPGATLYFSSDPTAATIVVNDKTLPGVAPASVKVDSGEYRVDMYLENFEPLSYTVVCSQGDSVGLHFILKSLPPGEISPDSLGLEYLPKIPLVDTMLARAQMETYQEAAQLFAIFPLAQGVLVRAFLGDERKDEGNVMIGAGVGLSLGSLLLGKIFSSRKRNNILKQNAIIRRENEAALLHNKSVDERLRAASQERLSIWDLENRRRGRVSVSRRNTLGGTSK